MFLPQGILLANRHRWAAATSRAASFWASLSRIHLTRVILKRTKGLICCVVVFQSSVIKLMYLVVVLQLRNLVSIPLRKLIFLWDNRTLISEMSIRTPRLGERDWYPNSVFGPPGIGRFLDGRKIHLMCHWGEPSHPWQPTEWSLRAYLRPLRSTWWTRARAVGSASRYGLSHPAARLAVRWPRCNHLAE